MPVCNDCGNRVAFVHDVEGTETRLYTARGDFDGTEYQQFESRDAWCADCNGRNVEFDA